ncbi:dynamin family protein [Schaalia sp. JY-X169]|uniref:dynamin family protein n=1 Tax=Schaalia sp. JY-X169 TaxID=2758572 RepID=UPI0015F5C244|nr:dynamin family protein [Schaalia sp. JY-X169]
MSNVAPALDELRRTLSAARFPLRCPGAQEGTETSIELAQQIDDYLLPRYTSLDAPLLAVVGGSTGAGKSLLVNSLVREHVARSSAIRPTTRDPLLVHAVEDGAWFSSERILPGLARLSRSRGTSQVVPDPLSQAGEPGASSLELVQSPAVPHGLAILDSPDIDSVVEANRRLAGQLLAAADMWIFVTTAARYSDAIPWKLLAEAASRNIVLGVVVNRMPAGTQREILPDLAKHLDKEGLGSVPIFTVTEYKDEDGLIPQAELAPLREWLLSLAASAASRAAVARQTLEGATNALLLRESDVVNALEQQAAAALRMKEEVAAAFARSRGTVEVSFEDGTLLRGEVLARWQEVVGTGEWMRKLESGVSSVRDRLAGWLRIQRQASSASAVDLAVEDSLLTSLVSTAEEAIANVELQWASRTESAEVAEFAALRLRSSEEREVDAAEAVRQWQRDLVEMVSSTGKDKKTTARLLAVGVNVVGAALMVVIFASTAGLTGAELAVAGGTAVAAQRVLEAVFGDDAVRKMTARAREDLSEKTAHFFEKDADSLLAAVDQYGINIDGPANVTASFAAVRDALRTEQWQ